MTNPILLCLCRRLSDALSNREVGDRTIWRVAAAVGTSSRDSFRNISSNETARAAVATASVAVVMVMVMAVVDLSKLVLVLEQEQQVIVVVAAAAAAVVAS